jgi:hypothetical protein
MANQSLKLWKPLLVSTRPLEALETWRKAQNIPTLSI